MAELFGVFGQEALQLGAFRGIAFLAVAQLLGQPLRQNANQCVGKVEWVHAHVQQPDDGLGR